ncbi:MAG: bifunctional adenosylcobinamide kinase/adenosylcobinamide-phosphate guanylyltransferase [Campylobacterota bacterium]|nr:bifunctional adenosylcobinamide kinase/adenosylcobinamide-phosphate guanylyltransferase [Campylobacterota bacterium]
MACKALFIGGIKSGKSKNAEIYTLKHSKEKPIYLATTEFFDDEMKERVEKHKIQRGSDFETIEESLKLSQALKNREGFVLVECVSMWINNMLHHKKSESEMIKEIEEISSWHLQTVWVINDVSCSVVSDNTLVREFIDINGRISQLLASKCQEVYNTVAGVSVKIK